MSGNWWRSSRFRWVLVATFLVMIAVTRAGAPEERDPYWSARAGWENLTGTPLIRPDAWSWSADGDWYPNSPAWNMLLGAGWHWFGYPGLFVVGVISMLVYFGLAWWVAVRLGARPLPGLVGFGVCTLAAWPLLSLRATLAVASLLLGSFLFADWWGRAAPRLHISVALAVPAAVGLVISTTGNWLHLSYLLFAPLTAVLWTLAWLLTPGLRSVWSVLMGSVAAVGLLAGCLLSPYGFALTMTRAKAVQDACHGIITEWSSAVEIGELKWFVVVGFAVAASGGVAWWAWREYRTRSSSPRLPLMVQCVAVSLPAALASLFALRFLGISLFAVVPLVAAATTELSARARDWPQLSRALGPERASEYTSSRYWSVVLVLLAVLLAPLSLVVGARLAKPPEAALVAHLPRNCRLFSSPDVAGALLLERPDIEVWIDGRADFYGRERLLDSVRVLSGQVSIPAGADCAVFETPGRGGWIKAPQRKLDGDPNWRRLAERNGYLLWVRD